MLECERAGVLLDDAQSVADYLVAWLDAKARRLKPTTVARYRDYLHNDLLPAFGAVRLERLTTSTSTSSSVPSWPPAAAR